MESAGPLQGIRVLDLSIMAAGPWAGSLLGQLGAEVIKVEPPVGDGTRWVHPWQSGIGTNYLAMNVNKRVMTLDLKANADVEYLKSLVPDADILIQNFSGGVIDRLGVGYRQLAPLNPRLIYCSVSGFGTTGPLAGVRAADYIIQAFSGFASGNGQPGTSDFEQFRFTGFLDLTSAMIATQSILAALLARQHTGRGRHLDVAMVEAALEMQYTRVAEALAQEQSSAAGPSALGSENSALVPDGAFQCLDKWIFLSIRSDAEWQALCQLLERPDLGQDDRFAHNVGRVAHRELIRAELESVLATRPAMWWLRALRRRGLCVGLAADIDAIGSHVQVAANEMIAHLPSQWGTIQVSGLPWRFSRSRCAVEVPPEPGNAERIRFTPADDPEPGSSGVSAGGAPVSSQQPLSGLRVLEYASGIGGPLCARRLLDLGAMVTKVEDETGDWLRAAEPRLAPGQDSASYAALVREKERLAVDLSASDGRQRLAEALREADIVVCDRDRQWLADLGIADHLDDVAAGRSAAIWVLVSPYGPVGPLATVSGSELTVQAAAGYTGYLSDIEQPPCRLASPVAETATAIFATQAVLAARYTQQQDQLAGTGHGGQLITVSMLQSLLSMETIQIAAQADPDDFLGARVGGVFYPEQRGWRCADGRITFAFGGALGKGRPGWQEFVSRIGGQWMVADPRFDPAGVHTTGIGVRVEETKADYERLFATHTADELVDLIRGLGGSAAKFQTLAQALSHPQISALGVLTPTSQAPGLAARVPAWPGVVTP